jgi:hypothetical protein
MQRCFLCLKTLDGLHKQQNLDMMQRFIKKECQPTPFVYQWLITQETSCAVCIPCLNWKRRCVVRSRDNKKIKRRVKKMAFILPASEKPFLPIDQMILFCVMPGRYHMPDKRCIERLLVSLCDRNNPILYMIPVNARYILQNIATQSVNGALEAWWKINNHTHIMRYPAAAKMIRNMLKKQDNVMEDLENVLGDDI